MRRIDSGMDRKMEVLALLKARGRARLSEVAETLGLTRQGALRHLEALRARGLVEVTVAPAQGRGRPGHLYALTVRAGEAFPSGHRQLATELVDFMETAELERFFGARAERLEKEYAAKLAGLSFEGRVRELARLARESGHMTEVVEREDGSLQLRHCNCPIQDVASRTGQPCRHEQNLYERLLGAPLARSTWVGAGDTSCTYDIADENKQLNERGRIG
jgi:predicted ArsR family transcriptional regulator